MAAILDLAVVDLCTGILQRLDHVATARDRHRAVEAAVPHLDRHILQEGRLRRITATADGHDGGEQVGPAHRQVPGAVATKRQTRQVDAVSIHRLVLHDLVHRGHHAADGHARLLGQDGIHAALPRLDPGSIARALHGQHVAGMLRPHLARGQRGTDVLQRRITIGASLAGTMQEDDQRERFTRVRLARLHEPIGHGE